MRELGHEAETDVRLYFTGGATAVLFGWRPSTIDVDIKLEPDTDRLLRALPRIKDKLEINIELASPDQFIPELPGWHERSAFITSTRRRSGGRWKKFFGDRVLPTQRSEAPVVPLPAQCRFLDCAAVRPLAHPKSKTSINSAWRGSRAATTETGPTVE